MNCTWSRSATRRRSVRATEISSRRQGGASLRLPCSAKGLPSFSGKTPKVLGRQGREPWNVYSSNAEDSTDQLPPLSTDGPIMQEVGRPGPMQNENVATPGSGIAILRDARDRSTRGASPEGGARPLRHRLDRPFWKPRRRGRGKEAVNAAEPVKVFLEIGLTAVALWRRASDRHECREPALFTSSRSGSREDPARDQGRSPSHCKRTGRDCSFQGEVSPSGLPTNRQLNRQG